MKTLREVLICCVLVALTAFLVQGSLWVQDGRAATQAGTRTLAGIDLLRISMQAQLTGKYGLLAEATAAARESRKTIDVLQATSLAERTKVAEFSDASIAAVRDLGQVARSADRAVQALRTSAISLDSAIGAIRTDAEHGQVAIDKSATLLATLDAGAGKALDRTTETISNVDALVVAAAPIEAHVLSTSRHLDAGSKSIEETLAQIREDFRPQKKSFWIKLADLATNGAFSMLFRLWPAQRVHEVGR